MNLRLMQIIPPLLLASAFAAHAADLKALTPRLGVALVGNGVPTTDSAAGPISGAMGIDFSLQLDSRSILSFEPGFDVYYFYSELLESQPATGPSLELPRAVPAPAESAASSWTAGLILSAPLVIRPVVAGPFTLVAGAGPALLFRTALGGQAPSDLNAWYFGKARWLYFEARAGIELALAPRMSFAADVRAFYPFANLWTDPDPAMALDGAVLRIGLGMRIALERPADSVEAAAEFSRAETEAETP